jgi:serine/threonine protein kinase
MRGQYDDSKHVFDTQSRLDKREKLKKINKRQRYTRRENTFNNIKNGLGWGTYGFVMKRGDRAIKRFISLHHLVHEYVALAYLSDCQYVVKVLGFNLEKFEIEMELYDGSIHELLYNSKIKVSLKNKMNIIRQSLIGLHKIHERGLTHGDIKPQNILYKKDNDKYKVVIADCGFVSLNKYARVDLTSRIYQEPALYGVYHQNPSHDIYSFGLSCIEILTGKAVMPITDGKLDWKYESILNMAERIMGDHPSWNTIKKMLDPDHTKRISSKEALLELFDLEVKDTWSWDAYKIRSTGLEKATDFLSIKSGFNDKNSEVNRCRIGYEALKKYLYDSHEEIEDVDGFVNATLFILYSIFNAKTEQRIGESELYYLQKLLSDRSFIINIMKRTDMIVL